MKIARSRITAQGQITVPAEVRRRLGLGPGATLEWSDDEEGSVVVRRVHQHSSEEVHRALFPDGAPDARSLEELKQGVRDRMRRRHARR